jgi:hypothetical protein
MTDMPARSFALPDLRIVPVETLIPHEHHDERRTGPLTARISEQRVLKNPPVVTALAGRGGERYVVLDGANRTAAARESRLPHMAVQVVRYQEPDVRLLRWNHALTGMSAADLGGALRAVPGLKTGVERVDHARALLARREILAYAVTPGADALTLDAEGDSAAGNEVLNAAVERYRGGAKVYRVAPDSLGEAQERIPDATALVVFPHFDPAEILELAATGGRLPAGITRHLIAWRALRVNIPLELLADQERSREEKDGWVRRWIRERMERHQVRFYEESTVVFDD